MRKANKMNVQGGAAELVTLSKPRTSQDLFDRRGKVQLLTSILLAIALCGCASTAQGPYAEISGERMVQADVLEEGIRILVEDSVASSMDLTDQPLAGEPDRMSQIAGSGASGAWTAAGLLIEAMAGVDAAADSGGSVFQFADPNGRLHATSIAVGAI